MKLVKITIPVLLLLAACNKDLTEKNKDPKNPVETKATSLLTNAQRRLSSTMASADVNLNIFRLIVQHWQQTTYLDESNYNLAKRNVTDAVWSSLYEQPLIDLQEAKRLIPLQEKDETVRKNQIAIADILQVYSNYYLVTTYGNIPYTEALNVDNPFPTYDDAKTVYDNLLSRLDADIAALNTASASFGNADIIYEGNTGQWKKFANTLKLKMALTIADTDNAKAKTAAENAVTAGIFTSNDDNALFHFLASPPNTNPIWVDLVLSTRDDFVAGSTLVNAMKNVADPRIDDYFTKDANGGYSGGAPGRGSDFAALSHVSTKITAPNYPGDLLDYSETEFLLAEAVERGYNVGGTAKEHYDKAITASIEFWEGTAAEAATYLAQAAVNYATATGTWQQKIGHQKWISLHNRGWDAWIEWRKFDYPQLARAANSVSVIPLRYPYPVSEQNVNRRNYEAASTAIGGDRVSTKLFWDKF